MKVHVAIYSHKHGSDTRVFATAEGAEAWRRSIADEWWDTEMTADNKKPDKPEEVADAYFDYMGDRGYDEHFNVEECDVEGLTDSRLGPVAVVMEGGLCQGVISNDSSLHGVPLLTLDYDVEGVDLDQIKRVDQGDGTTQEACVGGDAIGRSAIDLSKLVG